MAAPEIELIVRRPGFDYAQTPNNWMPGNPGFGYQLNGGSLTLPYLEPYLIRVMRIARAQLEDRIPDPDARARLERDIDLFNGQEANHFKIHREYNALLRSRYEGLEALEAELEADFARMLREESLAFNLGYAAGFETTGLVTSQLYFEDMTEGMSGADPAVYGLWGWHLAEEFEHRCVAFDVFRAFGLGWRERLRMFFYQAKHLNDFGSKAAALMCEQDRANGQLVVTPAEEERNARLAARQERIARRRIFFALMPWHDPRRHRSLEGADRFLAELEWV